MSNLDDMTSTELHRWVLNYPIVKEVATFLDAQADRLDDMIAQGRRTPAGDEWRAMAKKLRGET